MDKDNTDKILSRKFDDFTALPLEGTFETVKARVDLLQKKKHRRALGWLFSGVIGFTFLGILSVRNMLPPENITAAETAAGNKKTSVSPTPTPPSLTAADRYQVKKPMPRSPINAGDEKKSDVYSSAKSNRKEKTTSPAQPGLISNPAPPTQFGQHAPLVATKSPVASDHHLDSNKVQQPSDQFAFSSQENVVMLNPVRIHIAGHVNDAEIIGGTTINNTGKDLLHLKALEYKPVFFIGLSYQPNLLNYRFSQNQDNTPSTAHSPDFKTDYTNKRNANRQYIMHAIPGLKAGLILKNTLVIGGTVGLYKTREQETADISETDTIITVPTKTGTLTTFGNPPSSNLTKTTVTTTKPTQFTNTISYVYASLDLAWMIRRTGYRFVPGLSLGYHKLLKSSYLMVDENGYKYAENSTESLNKAVYNITFKAGLRKNLVGNFDLWLNPLFSVSPSSIFSQDYFMSQKPFGFGIEGALVYKFRR